MIDHASRLIVIPETSSTNSYLRHIDPPHATAVHAITQTAGRGQRGNKWESEPGKNVTLSLMLRPDNLPAERQFVISQSIALSAEQLVCDILYQSEITESVSVKWPNDIYVGDNKIAGILIENTVTGAYISSSVIGIGLNVNQRIFHSDAPNPISLANLTGRIYDPVEIAQWLADKLVDGFNNDIKNDFRELDKRFRNSLYRRRGNHRWREAETGKEFTASIAGVDSFGRLLLLEKESDKPRPYAFKEIIYI